MVVSKNHPLGTWQHIAGPCTVVGGGATVSVKLGPARAVDRGAGGEGGGAMRGAVLWLQV